MTNDLFGNAITQKEPRYSHTLRRSDRHTFKQRLARLQYVAAVIPRNVHFAMPPESHFVLSEANSTYVGGNFVATVLLAQAFIEHCLQGAVADLGRVDLANRGLAAIVAWFRANRLEFNFLMDKVDDLRRFRNPFAHLRHHDDPSRLMSRVYSLKMGPDEIIAAKAKEALPLMYQVAITRFVS